MKSINEIVIGDCREIMRRWSADGVKVQTCVTSPPYFGLRDYGVDGQIGLEQTPEQYIAAMVEVFRCVRDVLADDGTLWLNIGDSYAARVRQTKPETAGELTRNSKGVLTDFKRARPQGYKEKDLIGIPWMLAFALRADGWYLRQDIIWHKPNPMPESVRDRCTKAHEYMFLLSKSERYYFDSEAIKEPAKHPNAVASWTSESRFERAKSLGRDPVGNEANGSKYCGSETRNRRSVWSVATRPYKGAHFATFPPALIEPCILAGSRVGDIVLDPFMGSGTTAFVAKSYQRNYLGCELNPNYVELQRDRVKQLGQLF